VTLGNCSSSSGAGDQARLPRLDEFNRPRRGPARHKASTAYASALTISAPRAAMLHGRPREHRGTRATFFVLRLELKPPAEMRVHLQASLADHEATANGRRLGAAAATTGETRKASHAPLGGSVQDLDQGSRAIAVGLDTPASRIDWSPHPTKTRRRDKNTSGF